MDKNWTRLSKIKLLFLIFLFILSPRLTLASPASFLAAIGTFIVSTTTTILTTTIVIIIVLQVFLGVMGLINTLLANLISWIISPGAIQWQYTNNPFVNAGLEITGPFVSIGLVLALIAIAFATILRLEGWDTKRLLAKLIIAALLVYFSPVICGLIVDATNIFMYYFADRIGGLGILARTFLDVVLNLIRAFVGIPILQQITTVAASIVQLIVQLYMAFVLLAFFLAFLFRYAAIWIAVVLAPIAFVCWILPVTQRYWNFWWKNFIQWCLVGPICAFFLYLGARLASLISGAVVLTGFATNLGDTILAILPHLFTLGLLNLGVVLGIQGAGHGADMVLSLATRGFNFAKKSSLVQRGVGRVLGEAAERSGRVGTWLKRLEERTRQRPEGWAKPVAWLAGAAAIGAERGSGVINRYFMPYVVRARKTEIPKGFDELTPEEQLRVLQGYSGRDRIQLLAHMARTGTLGKITDEEARRRLAGEVELATRNPVVREQLRREIQDIYGVLFDQMTEEAKINLTRPDRQAEMRNRIEARVQELQADMQRDPEFARQVNDYMARTGRTIRDIAAGAIHFEELRPTEIAKLSPSSLQTIEARLGAHRITPAKMGAIIANFDVNTAESLLNAPGGWNRMLSIARTPEEQDELLARFQRENPHLMHWLFMSETGRNIQFLGRERVRTGFGGYPIFQQAMEEANSIIERVDSLSVVDRQLIELQNRINDALQKGQAGRARALNLNFREMERRVGEMINQTQDALEIRNTHSRLSQLLLSQPSLRRGEIYRAITGINTELSRRHQDLTGQPL